MALNGKDANVDPVTRPWVRELEKIIQTQAKAIQQLQNNANRKK